MFLTDHHVTKVLRVSHQFTNFPKEFTNGFESFEFGYVGEIQPWATRALVHTNFAAIDPSFTEKLESENVFELIEKHNVRRFSFDVGPCYKHVNEVDGQYIGTGEKLSPIDMMYYSEENLAAIRHKFPTDCELAIENLNYYPTGAYDDVCDGTFYAMACQRLKVGMVFDISHARVSAQNLNQPFSDFLKDFDFSVVKEIHLSRPTFYPDNTARDTHDAPQEEEFDLLQDIVDKTSGPVDVVIEYYRDVPGIVSAYSRLAEIFP